MCITIVRTAWNARLVDALEAGVIARLTEHGVLKVRTILVGGAYELPLVVKRAAIRSDAVVAIGILIKGETMHFEYISSAVSSGLMAVQLETNTPVIFGELSVLSEAQAVERCKPGSGLASSWADTALTQIATDP
ncbi:MAG: 6,7-dimethyl-8-ribityllumazine synthase [archaeon]|nr:6,7-dimethyl-8-ribityllumazine synthase [archaeon]